MAANPQTTPFTDEYLRIAAGVGSAGPLQAIVRTVAAHDIATPGAPSNTAVTETLLEGLTQAGPIKQALEDTIAGTVTEALDGFQSAPSYLDAPYTPGSNVFPINADVSKVAVWGSSSAEGIAPYLTTALSDLDIPVTVFNGGDAGAQSFHVYAHLGSLPAKLTFPSNTIPASGSVTVTADADFTLGVDNLKAYTGTIAGIAGTLAYSGGNLTFTRTTGGSIVAVPAGTPFIPTDGYVHRADVTLLWAGKNDLSSGIGVRPLEGIIGRTDQAFDWLAPLYKRTLVLGHFADSNASSAMVNDRIAVVNAAHAARYGSAFVDVQAYLMSAQVWTDTGITPTSGDLAQQAAGQKPASLSADAAHLNAAGYTAVAKLIKARLISLGWYEAPPALPPITSDDFSANATTIHARETDVAQGGTAITWVGVKDGNGADLEIASGVLKRPSASGSGLFLASLPMPQPDYRADFTVESLPVGSAFIIDVARPSSSSGANGYRLSLLPTGSLQVQKRVANAYSTIGTGVAGVTAGSRLGVERRETKLRVYLNGVLASEADDSEFMAAGFFGFGGAGSCISAGISHLVISPR